METNHSDLKCHHNLPPTIYASNRKHPGRHFYRCPKPIGEQCSFFLWVDEAIPSPSRNQLPPTPQSAQASGSRLHDPPSTPTPSSRKRTSPDDVLNSPTLSWQSQKRAKHGDEAEEDYPGSQGPASQSIASQPPTSDPSLNTSAPLPDEGPSMSQETVCSEVLEEISADSVASKIQFFTKLPDYIRKLERRKLAAEMSRDAKARKIVHLEAEVERLKKREKELEDVISMLESA